MTFFSIIKTNHFTFYNNSLFRQRRQLKIVPGYLFDRIHKVDQIDPLIAEHANNFKQVC